MCQICSLSHGRHRAMVSQESGAGRGQAIPGCHGTVCQVIETMRKRFQERPAHTHTTLLEERRSTSCYTALWYSMHGLRIVQQCLTNTHTFSGGNQCTWATDLGRLTVPDTNVPVRPGLWTDKIRIFTCFQHWPPCNIPESNIWVSNTGGKSSGSLFPEDCHSFVWGVPRPWAFPWTTGTLRKPVSQVSKRDSNNQLLAFEIVKYPPIRLADG